MVQISCFLKLDTTIIMKQMNQLLFLLLLVPAISINQRCTQSPTLAQINTNQPSTTCPTNSFCLQNGYCACSDSYVGGCSQTAQILTKDVPISATITNQQYTLFSANIDSEYYVMLLFQICHSASDQNLETIDIWDDDGSINILDKSTALAGSKNWTIKQGCVKLNTPYMIFSKQPNGKNQLFVLGIKLVSPGTIPLTIKLQVEELDFWDLIMKILFILGGAFILTLSIVIAYIVYKWKLRRRANNRYLNQDINIEHLQTYMPKFKQTLNINRHEDICSVCLLDLNQTDWLRRTVCGHVFHQECLDQWCKSNLNCPICRKSFQENCLKEQKQVTDVDLNTRSNMRDNLL